MFIFVIIRFKIYVAFQRTACTSIVLLQLSYSRLSATPFASLFIFCRALHDILDDHLSVKSENVREFDIVLNVKFATNRLKYFYYVNFYRNTNLRTLLAMIY